MADMKDIWKDPVWSKVIAAAILAIGAGILATLRGWWPVIGEAIVQAWHWLGESSSYPNWLLILLWLALGAVLFLAGIIVVANLKSDSGAQPQHWKSYTTDEFFGLQWVWRLDSSGDIFGIFALCLDCKCQVYERDIGDYGQTKYGYYCDVCGRDKATFDEVPRAVENKVKLRIGKNLRTGDWANARIN